MLNAKTLRHKVGVFLMRRGANLYFRDKEDEEELKQRVNADTYLGSWTQCCSEALLGEMTPMNSFDTRSVINVLLHKESFIRGEYSHKGKWYYEEYWNCFKKEE